jgi:hypothetical protein
VQSNGTFCRSTTPTSFWYVVYIVYQKAHRKWLVSRVCLVAKIYCGQYCNRLLLAKLLEYTGMHECTPTPTCCRSTTPPSFWYVVYIVYQKAHRKWLVSGVCLVAKIYCGQYCNRLLRAELLELTGIRVRALQFNMF